MRIYDFDENQIPSEIANITTIKESVEETIVLIIFIFRKIYRCEDGQECRFYKHRR